VVLRERARRSCEAGSHERFVAADPAGGAIGQPARPVLQFGGVTRGGFAAPGGDEFHHRESRRTAFYNSDIEQQGMPPAVQNFRREIAAAEALIFAVPEYNFSIPGVLKNALEWLSRPPNPPANGKPCALFGASVSPLGTARGQFHFRHVCVSLNLITVNTPHVDIASAKDKFDPEGRLVDQPSLDQLRQLLIQLQNLTIRLRNAW
jgi:chromate reductase